MANHLLRFLSFFKIITCASFIGLTTASYKDYEDLSHPYTANMAYFPGQKVFELTKDHESYRGNDTLPTSWYAAYSFCTGEHGGSHLDAPFHFSKLGWKLHEIPMSNLIEVRTIVVNIEEQVNKATPPGSYMLTVKDLTKHEETFGTIETGGIILVRTGWSKYWGDNKAYMGSSNVTVDGEEKMVLSFPGVSEEAAKWMFEKKKIVALGIDTPSIDPGSSQDYPVHKFLASKQVYGLENVANLNLLVDRQLPTNESIPASSQKCHYFNLFVLPIKIQDGTGGPARILAQCKGSSGSILAISKALIYGAAVAFLLHLHIVDICK